MKHYRREISVAIAILALAIILGIVAPEYFARENLSDLFLANMPMLMVALGMTLVILTGQIDISVGSVFAICSVAAGVLAKWGLPAPVTLLASCLIGTLLGAVNGALVAYVRIPSIVVTLATMVALRDALRWLTQGAWVQDLPRSFQWFGLPQSAYPVVTLCAVLFILAVMWWGMRNLAAGRAVYATGSNREAARLTGIDTELVILSVFAITGTLTGFAALLNSVRFNQIPSNSGLGLEMKVIASVVVGGTAITGGRGSLIGTVFGAILLGAIGPALTFLNVNAYWERAMQGGIILTAVIIDAVRAHSKDHGTGLASSRA
jgi:rhamnose transport system permease protein